MNRISIIADNDSWIIPYANKLINELRYKGLDAFLCHSINEIKAGFICFILGCTRIIPSDTLRLNKYNLVVHESDLPMGKGFAPMSWQILEGKNAITFCLIEASEEVDAGDIWIKDVMHLDGNELCSEWRHLQGEKTISMCLDFVDNYKHLKPTKQTGESSYYPRRRPIDSRMDINKSISDQFQLLRVVDNERYPAFFEIAGTTYVLQIFKKEPL